MRKSCLKKDIKGFTLIELLVVVLIVAILAAIAVPQYQKTVLKTRYMQVLVLGRALQDAVNMYYLQNGVYPTILEGLDIQMPGNLSSNKKETYIGDNKYRCYLDVRGDSFDSVWCGLITAAGMLSYRASYASWDKGNRYCVAKGNRYEEICKSVGGTNPFDNGTGLMHYKLP